jgi:plasmid stabilization system protein ParE
MGEFQLRITSQAARDLQEIVTYIARDNPAAAERFGLALVEKAELPDIAAGVIVIKRFWHGARGTPPI